MTQIEKSDSTIPKKPTFKSPPLIEKQTPRCPPMVDIKSAEELIPYLDAVAKRPYNHGLHAGWDLQPGERVLLRVDNWHDPLVIDACKLILEKYNTKYEIKYVNKGPIIKWKGHDEVEYYLARSLINGHGIEFVIPAGFVLQIQKERI